MPDQPASRKPQLLWVSESPCLPCVGQSRVTREFCSRLSRFCDVTVAGFIHDKKYESDVPISYPVIPTARGQLKEKLPAIMRSVQPDVIVFSHDYFLVHDGIFAAKETNPNVRLVGYLTVDGEPINPRWRSGFDLLDVVVIPSRYGQRVVEASWPDMATTYVPYGVDTSIFHPPEQGKDKMKALVDAFIQQSSGRPGVSRFKDNFCVASIGMNQGRKNLGATYYAWKEFEKRHTDVCLWVLTHPHSPNTMNGTYDIGLISDLERAIIMYSQVPEPAMARILTACDAFLLPTIGEGFGLPILEAMAVGAVPIVTDFSAHTEFCDDDTAFLLDWVPLMGEFNTTRAIVKHESVLENLEMAYSQWKDKSLTVKSDAGVARAKEYSWDTSALSLIQQIALAINRPSGWQNIVARRVL